MKPPYSRTVVVVQPRHESKTQSESDSRKLFKTSLKVLGVLIAGIGFFILKWEYFDTQRHEFTRSYYEKQYDVYQRLCAEAGNISAARDFADAQRRVENFQKLFYGDLFLVADLGVYNASNAFREKLNQKCADMKEVRTAAAIINARCRDSLRETSKPVVPEAIQNELLQLSEELAQLTGAKKTP